MEDPIVIPTVKSVQLTLQRSSQKTEKLNNNKNLLAKDVAATAPNGRGSESGKLWQAEVNQEIAEWQQDLSRQCSLLKTLEELLKADMEALKAGHPPPEPTDEQRKVLATLSLKDESSIAPNWMSII